MEFEVTAINHRHRKNPSEFMFDMDKRI